MAQLTAAGEAGERAAILEVDHLRTYYPARKGLLKRQQEWVRAVDDVSFTVRRGETFGLVGESGCGKSTLVRSILQLEKAFGGHVRFEGKNLLGLPKGELKRTRADIQAIFQDPYGSLDPRMKVGDVIAEGLVVQGSLSRRERRDRVEQLIAHVGLRTEHLSRYPHEFSGGQQQRIAIARALALRPKLIVADEPVSALDVSIQSQVLNLLSDLQEEYGLTYLFIAHDLSVVEYVSDRVGVMYLGKLVEIAATEELYAHPLMPYTQALISAIPAASTSTGRERIVLRGDAPSPLEIQSGCPFRSRCWLAEDICAEEIPQLREVRPEHWVACHLATPEGGKS